MKTAALFLPILLWACGDPPNDAAIAGRVARGLHWVSRVEAIDGADVASSAIDASRRFDIRVAAGGVYRVRVSDESGSVARFVVFEDGGDAIAIAGGDAVDVGTIATTSCGEQAVGECDFETYNLDVRVGDRFVLTNFVQGCEGQLGVDYFFGYEDGETWNLEAFNSDGVVEMTEADLAGGNHGEGAYRVFMFGRDGDELDHVTIRIDHDDVSDVGPGDEVPPSSGGASRGGSAEECAGAPGSPDADGDGAPDRSDPDGDGDGIVDGACESTAQCGGGLACIGGRCVGV